MRTALQELRTSMKGPNDTGNTIIEQLQFRTYLVKMHNLIRNMALQVATVNPGCVIEAGVGLEEVPSEEPCEGFLDEQQDII
ncbi:hypothetical protein FEM48_Zijuj01G0203700 [Ziziphus jujuba var. spinosa]|uniref:Uncharacterized protein n=1 Tax=Ziziphus jujuba var. spinosa TaxID=714518 RepID=A0A978W3D2_ZIZJJ|nr:hypothetical protein FEM48_Zijuj01G0203700 [Ziziphus jujuba var. spinosa]